MNKIKLKQKALRLLNFPYLRSFISKWGQKCTILYFHRVIDDKLINLQDGPNRSLCVTLSFFENLVNYLSKEYSIISLDDFRDLHNTKTKSKYLIITFDDGYKDNYLNAVPILSKNNVPATFYITTDFIDRKGNVWWYEIWDLIHKSHQINFSFKGTKYIIKTQNKQP